MGDRRHSVPSARPSKDARVAIPRLHRASGGDDDSVGSDSKHRVSHACEPCRQRKTKCSGEKPVCKHCQDFKINCYYADGKRDRAKTELHLLKRKVETYERLLEQLRGQVDSAAQLAIAQALHGTAPPDALREVADASRDGESLVTADVGSAGSADHITDDLNDVMPYPTGYMGKNSEVAWIQRVAHQLAQEARDDSPSQYTEVDDEYQFKTPAYHLDDVSISIAGGQVDPYAVPTKRLADKLVDAFFSTVWPTFPLISKRLFMAQYEAFYQSYFPPGSSKRWLAMLNLLCAIGALYGKLIHAEWNVDDTDHLKFFARARVLSLDHGSLFEVADLQQVQVVGMAGLYLVASNQTNRAFNMIGLAIRYAETLGLNLRNDVPDLDEVEKEMRVRMWHALYSAEDLLCCMTGRPSAIHDKDCTVPLPRPIDENVTEDHAAFNAALKGTVDPTPLPTPGTSSMGAGGFSPLDMTPSKATSESSESTQVNPTIFSAMYSTYHIQTTSPDALFFLEHTKLNRITARVLAELYSPHTITKSWSDIQGLISALELEAVKWRTQLPGVFEFGKRHRDIIYARQKMTLGLQYHNVRILINRPCLCRFDYRIPNESKRSKTFNRSAAATCISAAREMVALLPDEPNPVGLISISPWWCLLHHLVTAGVILMVEISMRAEHNPQQAEGLLNDSKKVVRWLASMANDSLAAERSWAVLMKLLIISAPKIGRNTADVERDINTEALASSTLRHPHHEMPNMPEEMVHLGPSPPNMQQQQQQQQSGMWADPDTSFLFRNLISNSFSFTHTRFDDAMMVMGDQPHHAHAHHLDASQQPPIESYAPDVSIMPSNDPNMAYSQLPSANNFPAVPHHHHSMSGGPPPPPPPPPPQPHPQVDTEIERVHKRAAKRMSQGVTQIELPNPAFNHPWGGAAGFMTSSQLDAAAAVQGQLDAGAQIPQSRKGSSSASAVPPPPPSLN